VLYGLHLGVGCILVCVVWLRLHFRMGCILVRAASWCGLHSSMCGTVYDVLRLGLHLGRLTSGTGERVQKMLPTPRLKGCLRSDQTTIHSAVAKPIPQILVLVNLLPSVPFCSIHQTLFALDVAVRLQVSCRG